MAEQRVALSSSILRDSAGALQELSAGCRESVVLWIGTRGASEAVVKRILVPPQAATADHFDVSLAARLEIIRNLASTGDTLVAQLHTHPGSAFHSPVDDRIAIPRHTGALSIVIPGFAIGWDGNLPATSVNEHLGRGVWRELTAAEVSRTFEVNR